MNKIKSIRSIKRTNKVITGIWLCLLTVLSSLSSCSEFIEPSISDDQVILHSPAAGFETNKYSQSFWWEEVENARTYRLQVVSPSFDNVGFLALDTLISSNKFNFTLEPGVYQWRVRAENSGSETAWVSRTFTIHESSITAQQVQIIGPGATLITNQASLNFRWYSLYGANKYRLQIDTNDFADEATMVYNSAGAATELTVPFTREKVYKWRLRAENDTTESKWSAVRTFTYDHTPPVKVNLNAPDNNGMVTSPVALSWIAVSGAKNYQLVIYKTDPSNPYNNTFPLTLTGTSYSFTAGQPGETLNWKVRAVDEAGNLGEYSERRSFIIQQ